MMLSKFTITLATLLVIVIVSVSAVSSHRTLRHRLSSSRYTQTPSYQSPFDKYLQTGLVTSEDDPLSQLRTAPALTSETALIETESNDQTTGSSFLEVAAQSRVQKVRSYCEICILVMQMKQRGEPHLCAGLNANYYITCIEILESLLRADKAVVYWLKNGCMHMDSTGPEIVRPCPALSICSWVPNLFAQPPSLVRDGVESLCPKDPKFLPTIPNEYKTNLQGGGTAQTPGKV